ncbi:MAG: carbohydrate ABC transporter permease [Euzebyales bacterium]|nr:carbohydrate ABC transporter permease [Euzebyales bacterium]MBA3621277.1 carbohydrate ABC transporter permease [Euzebyales bacterium]
MSLPEASTVTTSSTTRPARATVPAGEATQPKPSGRWSARAISLLLWGYAAIALFPLVLMALNSLRPSAEIYASPLALPTSPTLDSYARAWQDASFASYFRNSVVVTVGAVALGTAVSVLAAYPLGRYVFFGSRWLSLYFLSGLMLPIRLAILPIFYLLASLSLVDSHLGIILVYAASGVPFSVFILSTFFRQLPRELEEAARIDGAGELAIFGRVLLPLVRPAVATVVVFQFVPLWNDFFFPLVLLRSTEKATLPVGLTTFFGQFQTDWSTLFAGLMIATVPLVVLFVVATKQIVAGLTAGIGK